MNDSSDSARRDYARERATYDVHHAFRELAANILRVTAGAGRPHELGRNALVLVKALNSYHDEFDYYPDSLQIFEALDYDVSEEIRGRMSNDHLNELAAEDTMLKGALRFVAGRILDQRTQAVAGESLMWNGIRHVQKIRDERYATMITKQRVEEAAQRAAKRAAKRKGGV